MPSSRCLAIACIVLGGLLVAAAGPRADALDPRRSPSQYVHRSWSLDDGLPQSSVLDILQDRKGYLWLATNGGLARFDGVHFQVFTQSDHPALPSDRLLALEEDERGDLWIGTYGSGQYHFDGARLSHVGRRQGLMEDVVSMIVEDARERFWMTGNHGLYRLPRRGLEAVVEGRAQRVEVKRFDADDGMPSSECNGGGQPAGLLTANGELWVPTLNGVALFDTRDRTRNPLAPSVLIESVVLDGVAVDPRQPAVFAAGARKLEIRYTALSFADPAGVRFRYRLHGRDQSWSEAGPRRVAYYPLLPPGENRFDVIAANGDGVGNRQEASFSFTVQPRLADTPILWLLLLLLVVLVAGGVVGLRLRAVHRREQRLAADVSFRTAELREAQAKLEAANRRLARLARVDALTGIPNRRSLMEHLDTEWRRAVRHSRPLGLLMIDVDCFKSYNDLHGHPVGDDCLRQVAALLASGLRRADETLARYGGEELAAVVPETSQEDLRELAEALRRCVAAARIHHGDSPVADHVTVSIGGAVIRPAAWDSLDRLVAAADAALYRAKEAGRNRVETVDLGVAKEDDLI